MAYFKNIHSLAELKKEYRHLALENHPDKGGSTEAMQQINVEFERLHEIWKDDTTISANASGYENDYAGASAKEYADFMYNEYRWKGCNYKGQRAPEIVELVRNWMKETYPKYKFSVSRHNYNSIHIYLVKADFEAFKKDKGVVFHHDVNHYYIDNDDTLTDRAKEVMKNVCDFVMSYNFDDSDPMTDYFCTNFYLTLGVGTYKKPYKVELPKLDCKGKKPDVFKHPEGAAHKAIRQALGGAYFSFYNSQRLQCKMVLGEDSYEDYWERIVNRRRYTKFTLDLKKMYLNTVRAFDEHGHLPNGRPCAKLLFSSNYKKLNPGYKFLMDELRNRTNMTEENLPKSAKYTTLALFLLEMQIAGAVILNDVTDKLVLDFFMTGKRKGSKHTQSHLRQALDKLRDLSPDIPRIISLLPKMKSKKRLYNNLRNCEMETIKDCLSNPLDNRMTLREKAIVALALYTGMRGCDIANLKAGDIDWENEEIRLIQVKTGQPLVLPLSANVGNALLEYILNERNAEDRSEYVFPSKVQLGERLS